MFHAYSSIFTKSHISRNICPYSRIFRQIQAHSESWHYRPVSISTCSSSQVLLSNHCSNLFGNFFHFCFKSKHSTLFFQDSISIITVTTIIACHAYVSMPSTPLKLAAKPHKHVTHSTQATHASTSPTRACYPCKHTTHTTNASTLAAPTTLARIAHHFSNSL